MRGCDLILLPWLALGLTLAVWGQPRLRKLPGPQDTRPATIRIDATMVLVPVAVADRRGRVVTGLAEENFRVSEDGVEQPLSYFSREDAPVSVGVVLDCSRSMTGLRKESRQAVRLFLETLHGADEAFLAVFRDRPEMVTGFTRGMEEIESRLLGAETHGRTALLDAVVMAMGRMKDAGNARKALLVISDGADNASRFSESETRGLAREADVQIHAIRLMPRVLESPATRSHHWPELLEEIAELTGGRSDRRRAAPQLPARLPPERAAPRRQVPFAQSGAAGAAGIAPAGGALPPRLLCTARLRALDRPGGRSHCPLTGQPAGSRTT